MSRPIQFSIEKKLSNTLGRVGLLSTPHGDIKTPAFVVVGTKGTVKAVLPDLFSKIGMQTVLANTYHLYLQPGDDIVRDNGGLHAFMNYFGPTWTDSGGFQVFSLGEAFGKGISKLVHADPMSEHDIDNRITPYNKDLATSHGRLALIDEEGVTFTSHIDGSMHRFTAERSIEIQHNIGADIIFAFDECTSPTASIEYQKEAMDRTHRWADRSLKAHRNNIEANTKQGIFGVIQGGRYENLRKESARILGEMDFDGYGIGGSFSKEDLHEALCWVNEILPEKKPRHLLGIGEPLDIFMGIENGCDTFDCVAPTRLARNGSLYTEHGRINITNEKYKNDHTLLSEWCPIFLEATYTRSYLAHLFRAQEMLAGTLASINNLWFIVHLVDRIRDSILEDRYFEFKEEFLKRYYKDK